jgi:curli biogenesis system outer membrane secretion channel CsgG
MRQIAFPLTLVALALAGLTGCATPAAAPVPVTGAVAPVTPVAGTAANGSRVTVLRPDQPLLSSADLMALLRPFR